MSDRQMDITRRKVLGALGAVGAAGAGAGFGTSALFNDTEAFEGNSIVAGELDLKVGWQQTYTGPNPGNGGVVETHPVNAFPDSNGDGIQDISGVIYGVEFDDGLYAIDLVENEAILIADSGGMPASSSSPNGHAFDPQNRRLYYSVDTGSSNEIWFYDLQSGSNTQAGTLEAQAAGAGWYDGRYWYIKNETDDLNAVTFDSAGMKTGETTELGDLTGNDRQYRFGDIAITTDGFLYGSTLGSTPSTAEFFTVDIPGGAGTYTELYTGNESDWTGDPTGLQLGLDQNNILYGQDAGNGEFFEINVTNEEVTSVTTFDDLAFTDITSREEVFLICTRPAPTFPDAFQSDNYPHQENLIQLSDVKPGDEGEITFSLRLCDNPGYLWLTLDNFDEDDGAHPEPEPGTPVSADESGNDGVDGGQLAENTMVRIWYDEDCDNEYDESDETLVFGPGIGGYTDFDGGSPATLRAAADVIQRNGGQIPLDGDPSTTPMDFDDGATSGNRDCLPGETGLCIGVEWWVPGQVGNVVQGDTVTFDLGFYTQQCRNSDGSLEGN